MFAQHPTDQGYERFPPAQDPIVSSEDIGAYELCFTPLAVLAGELASLLAKRGLEAQIRNRLEGNMLNRSIEILVELGAFVISIHVSFVSEDRSESNTPEHFFQQCHTWRGLPITESINVILPNRFGRMHTKRAKVELASSDELVFEPAGRYENSDARGESDSTKLLQINERGTVAQLAAALVEHWADRATDGVVENIVDHAALAIERASIALGSDSHAVHRQDGDSNSERIRALVWLNALVFQELLARNLDTESLPSNLRGRSVSRPHRDGDCRKVLSQWESILEINWWPIYSVACETLRATPPTRASRALRELLPVAGEIVAKGVSRRHDVVGRIFHRLLGTRRFLAANYTTIPAAVLLAGLAFDSRRAPWRGVDWSSQSELGKLRIVDPACGSGTLLMAALQEALAQHRRAGDGSESQATAIRALLENALHGYDVIPTAVHLTAATLYMAETRQLVGPMPLFWMPHDVYRQRARLGSLEFLADSPSRGLVQMLPGFEDPEHDPRRVSGTGRHLHDAYMPEDCDLVIANPPYTRAGGPGASEHTAWNPIFGSVLSGADARLMQNALKRRLDGTPASLYAGLGSAFMLLASERVKAGGRIAFVLPATILTGSRWRRVREMLLTDFDVEWVVTSHDARNRSARASLPGRRFVAFSESTRIAETLLIATKKRYQVSDNNHRSRFVNLRCNPDEPVQASALARALLATVSRWSYKDRLEICVGDTVWGEVLAVKQGDLDGGPWTPATFAQGKLAGLALTLTRGGTWSVQGNEYPVPIAPLEDICELGPYHMQIKNPTYGLFDISESEAGTRRGAPAIWHHKSDRITTLETDANARLLARPSKDADRQSEMLARAGRLQLAGKLRHASQRVAAVLTEESVLGVTSWITLSPKRPLPGKEEALCLWLNGTLGLLLRITHANRPYLGRTDLPHELTRTLPVLDVDRLSEQQLEAARKLFGDLRRKPLLGFAHLAKDPVRRELDHRFFEEVLGYSAEAELDQLSKMLNREPTLTTRH